MSKIDGKRILITGGSGSLGHELVKRLVSGVNGKPKSITVLSRNETKQHEMRLEFPQVDYYLGDVRDKTAMYHVVEGKDIIIHAASMKHVRNCTLQPELAYSINVEGTENLMAAVKHSGIDTVLGVSSDKGRAPENWYGKTKAKQENIILNGNNGNGTRCIAVCYGNVMASNGSVIQKWYTRINNHEPITVNDPNMTRFLVGLPQAVDTILTALEEAQRGEIYVPIIPASTVGDLAAVVKNGRDIPVIYTGKGADEKMHETLITEEEAERTIKRGKYYVVTRSIQDEPALDRDYVSRDHLIGKEELKELLDRYGLLIPDKGLELATARGLN